MRGCEQQNLRVVYRTCALLLPCHSEPVTDVTGVGIRTPRPRLSHWERWPSAARTERANKEGPPPGGPSFSLSINILHTISSLFTQGELEGAKPASNRIKCRAKPCLARRAWSEATIFVPQGGTKITTLFQAVEKARHCEPVRRLAWQSVTPVPCLSLWERWPSAARTERANEGKQRRAASRRPFFYAISSAFQHFSNTTAVPIPPPMHRVARPFLASGRFCISCSRVTMIRAPDAPTG